MSRRARIIRNVALGLSGLFVLLVVGALLAVRTDAFREYVRRQIITATEDGTGGRVELQSFAFEWSKMRAYVTGFVIHGNEPAGAEPFVYVDRVELHLRLFTSIKHLLDVAYLGVQNPRSNIMILADGRTNVPTPKVKKTSDKTVLDTLVDLAVDRFELTNGRFTFDKASTSPINIRGENLRAQLVFNPVTQIYKGQLDLEPAYAVSGRQKPVKLAVSLPIAIERDRIQLQNGKLTSELSQIVLNGSVENLRDLKLATVIDGTIALADLKALGDLPIDASERNAPSVIGVQGNATIAANTIRVEGLNLAIGESKVQASGTLKDPQGNGALEVTGKLALDELGRLAKLPQRPQGIVQLKATAKLDAADNYLVTGEVDARRISFVQDGRRYSDIDLKSAVRLDRHKLDLEGLRLSALGGVFTGNAALEEFSRYQLKGTLQRFDIQRAARLFKQDVPYDGFVSGPVEARGDLKQPGTRSIVATAKLGIAPGKRGIPVSGKINAEYRGSSDQISLTDSFIALPNTRLTLSGAVGKQVNVAFTTRNLDDILAAIPAKSRPSIGLNGEASFTGAMTGSLNAPKIVGHLAATRFTVEDRMFDSLAADVSASPSRVEISSGSLSRGGMLAEFKGAAGLVDWKPLPSQPLSADATIKNGDMADLMVLAGQRSAGYSGTLGATAHVTGTIGNPQGTVNIDAANGTLDGEAFDRINAKVDMSDQLVTLSGADLIAGKARIHASAEYRHPRDSFLSGRLHAKIAAEELDLAQVRRLQRQWPQTSGDVRLDADISGELLQVKAEGPPKAEFVLSNVTADVTARDLRFEGRTYGALTATARTQGQTVNYSATSDFAGSNIRVKGETQLAREYPTKASASIQNLPVERVLALAKRPDLAATGVFSGTAEFNGTVSNPQGSANFELAKLIFQNEPCDRVRGQVTYLAQSVDVPRLELACGSSHVALSARYDHPRGNLQQGKLQFKVDSSKVDLASIRNVQMRRPGLAGTAIVAASGSASIADVEPRVLFDDLNANVAVTGVSANGKNFGDLKLTAKTAGQRLNFELASNLAGASIQGRGNAELRGEYPLNAELTAREVTWMRIQSLLGVGTSSRFAFDGVTDAELKISGPLRKTDNLTGSLLLPRFEVTTIPANDREIAVKIRNEGPISARLERGLVSIQSLHLTGPKTDIQVKGAIPLSTQAFDLSVNANTNLEVLQNMNRDIVSSGSVAVAATVRGTRARPQILGQAELKNASLNYTELPNGITNANGVIAFNGNSASIRNLTAETGGGKLTLGGFASYRDALRFGLRATAANVRVRVQQGVSIASSANVNLTGTRDASVLSGTVTIDRVTYAPQSDFGSILYRAAPPVQTPKTPSPILDNMKLDLTVRTSSATAVQASQIQRLQMDADLRVRGTAAQPGVLGRVAITEGELVFFGSVYKVNTGNISFYNPLRIEPILNLSLGTQAKGVDVSLNVTGPVDNMKLSYTSDPPLQFQEIISLLASGKTPTSDPTLLANEPSQPPQTFQQMGESQIVSKAIADPLSSRLERVFGVSKLKIDPTFTGGSEPAQAKLTLQQQITRNLTFTYVTALNDPNTQIIRAEWALNPQWSAVASRDQNGIVSLNFFYKKQFR